MSFLDFPHFGFPYYNKRPYQKYNYYDFPKQESIIQKEAPSFSKDTSASQDFFEIFGIKLYLDDVLIICLLFFLYTEKVDDESLFICLILLLLS